MENNIYGTWPAPWKLRLLFWWARHCDLDVQPAPSNRLKAASKVPGDVCMTCGGHPGQCGQC